MADNSVWGPRPPKSSRNSGGVGEASLGTAVADLHKQHPHHPQVENAQRKAIDGRHQPVGSVYKGRA